MLVHAQQQRQVPITLGSVEDAGRLLGLWPSMQCMHLAECPAILHDEHTLLNLSKWQLQQKPSLNVLAHST